jgi:hypothetical protein
VQWRFDEFDQQFRNGKGALLLLEEVDETVASVLHGRAVAVRCEFLLDLPGASLLLGDVQLQELDVVRGGRGGLALGAEVV